MPVGQYIHYSFNPDYIDLQSLFYVAFIRFNFSDNQCLKREDFEIDSQHEVYCYNNATELSKRIQTETVFPNVSDLFKQNEYCPQALINFIPISPNLKRNIVGNLLELFIENINFNPDSAINLWTAFCFYKNNIESIQISGRTLPYLAGFELSLREPVFGNLKDLTLRETGPQADIAPLMQYFAPNIRRLDLRNGDILFDVKAKLCDDKTTQSCSDTFQTNPKIFNMPYSYVVANGDVTYEAKLKLCDVTRKLEYLDLSQTNAC